MLQIKSIKTVPVRSGEQVQIEFVGECWRDFHLVQEILRAMVSYHFCIESSFGFAEGLKEVSMFKYPKDRLITLICQRNHDGTTKYGATWMNTPEEVFNKAEEAEIKEIKN